MVFSYGLESSAVEEGMTPSVETRLVIEEFERWKRGWYFADSLAEGS